MNEFFTTSGVRVRLGARRPGNINWLFLPGGPGIGSESLQGLLGILDVPGSLWLVDLPGDGSNTDYPGAGGDPYAQWPQVLLEAAFSLPDCVYVGHSTGGMYLLSVPELASCLRGLVLISSAPDASWHPRFVQMTELNPLPEVDAALAAYLQEATNERLGEIAVASAPWNFTPEYVMAGRQLLASMPYNKAATDWSDCHFDHTYQASWWPEQLPTLILSGADDRIVAQDLWDQPQFQGKNIRHSVIEQAAHFIWIENPDAVRQAFRDFVLQIIGKES